MNTIVYTKSMFEKELIKYKNRILIRNGEFVGLYKYLPERSIVVLTKSLNNRLYGFQAAFRVSNEGNYWGTGGVNGLPALIECNEAHLIPFGYDLRRNNHLEILNKSLGGCYSRVFDRIENRNPNPENQRSVE